MARRPGRDRPRRAEPRIVVRPAPANPNLCPDSEPHAPHDYVRVSPDGLVALGLYDCPGRAPGRNAAPPSGPLDALDVVLFTLPGNAAAYDNAWMYVVAHEPATRRAVVDRAVQLGMDPFTTEHERVRIGPVDDPDWWMATGPDSVMVFHPDPPGLPSPLLPEPITGVSPAWVKAAAWEESAVLLIGQVPVDLERGPGDMADFLPPVIAAGACIAAVPVIAF